MSHVGPADVFISHTWGALWGTLVAAVLDGAAAGRKCWVDNVAVRQFPGNTADLDFAGVIERCTAVLMVAQALPGVAGLETEEDQSQSGWPLKLKAGQAIPANERSLFAGCRVWCVPSAFLRPARRVFNSVCYLSDQFAYQSPLLT
jgi:hypothetical protein